MVKLIKLLLYFLLFLAFALFFAPKEKLYFALEKELQGSKLILSNEKIQERAFGISIENARVDFNSIPSAEIKSVDLSTFLFYNKLILKDISLSSVLSSFVPTNIQNVVIEYTIVHPTQVLFRANGGFGEMSGRVELHKRELHIKVKPSLALEKKNANTMSYLQKNDKGEYTYVKAF